MQDVACLIVFFFQYDMNRVSPTEPEDQGCHGDEEQQAEPDDGPCKTEEETSLTQTKQHIQLSPSDTQVSVGHRHS